MYHSLLDGVMVVFVVVARAPHYKSGSSLPFLEGDHYVVFIFFFVTVFGGPVLILDSGVIL
jgi:hypothetical protein